MQHVERIVAQGRERSRGAAELRGQAQLCKPPARVDDPDEPARSLQPERRRHRLLEQRPARGDRGAMCVGELRGRVRHAVELGNDDRRRVARDERGRGVEDVLAGGAPVNLIRALAQPAHERLDGIARAAAVPILRGGPRRSGWGHVWDFRLRNGGRIPVSHGADARSVRGDLRDTSPGPAVCGRVRRLGCDVFPPFQPGPERAGQT